MADAQVIAVRSLLTMTVFSLLKKPVAVDDLRNVYV